MASEYLTAKDASELRRTYASRHSVTKGFWSGPPIPGLPIVGCCRRCGREYVAMGAGIKDRTAECYTCGSRDFAVYAEEETAKLRDDTIRKMAATPKNRGEQ